jgi:hypothetical protein
MPVSPDEVTVRKEYETTPAGVQEFIDDQLKAFLWVVDETHVFRVPDYLAKCCGVSAWEEMVGVYRSLGWRVHPVISAFTLDHASYVELYFTKTS